MGASRHDLKIADDGGHVSGDIRVISFVTKLTRLLFFVVHLDRLGLFSRIADGYWQEDIANENIPRPLRLLWGEMIGAHNGNGRCVSGHALSSSP